MPIYEYRCESCGHQLEAMQKMSDPRLTECPQCHGDTLEKLMSAGSFKMKSSSAGACPACE